MLRNMISVPFKSIIFIGIVFCAVIVGTQNATLNLNIPLNKSITWLNRELYSNFVHINRSSIISVNFININKNVSFIVFQVHSHLYNVTAYNNTLAPGSYVTGTNVGLYSSVSPIDTMFIFNQNEDVDLDVLISVHGYGDKDPIPGGCNMEFPISVSPFMRAVFKKDVILVYAPSAKYYNDPICNDGSRYLDIKFYMMYLPERDFEAATYFDGIKKMLTLENIREYGDVIPMRKWPMRRTLSAYPGTGAIYVVVASDKNMPEYYSVYIPTHSYGCSLLTDENCELVDDNLSKFVCASLMFLGVFVCYFGHRFFKTEMFLFGMLSGVIITYIIISLMSDLDRPALLSGSLLSGAFFGAIWLTFWWYYGIPVIAVFLPALIMGFLISAIMYNQFPGDVIILHDDFNFWILFIMIMILSTLMLVSVAFVSNMLCCAVLGAYAVVYPMDFYLGSNLKYIVINTVRRATVDKFNDAMLMLPFEWRDVVIVIFWVGLAVSGFLLQHYHNRGRPPFPPPPRNVRPGRPEPSPYGAIPTRRMPTISIASPVIVRGHDERTPLLA